MRTVDTIALMVTASCSVILVLVVASPLLTGRPLSEDKARMVAGLLDSFMALIAVYMGSKMRPAEIPVTDPAPGDTTEESLTPRAQ